MLKTFRLAMVLLWREWRAGEWIVVFLALLLAISTVTAIHFYTDRLFRGIIQQSTKILGGDLVVTSTSPFPMTWKQESQRLHLRYAEVWVYPSVVRVKNQLQLINIQAASNNYPLSEPNPSSLAPHTAWAEPRLLPLLAIKMNDVITIGAANFRIVKMLTSDVDTLNTGWVIAPKMLIRLDDVPSTHTVIPGSRVEYRLLLVGEQDSIKQFRKWIVPQLNTSQRLLDISNQQTSFWNVLLHTENYIQLVLLVGLMMSGVAIAMSIQQYMRRHYDHVALWRCLGAKENQIIFLIIWQLLAIALIAGGLGILLGYLAQSIFSHLFKDVFQFSLPAVSMKPILLGFAISAMLLFLFAYPLISELPYTSPLYIWRKQLKIDSKRSRIYWISILSIVILSLYWWMNFTLLSLFFIDILLLSIGFLYLLSIFLLSFIRLIMHHTEGTFRRGLSQLVHYPESVSIQIVGFTLVFMEIFLLKFVRTDLVEHWQHSLPSHSPNYFAFNIAPNDLPLLQQFFKEQQINIEGIYPLVRGRLIARNGKAIMTAIPVSAQGNNALHRDLNLSWMWQFPSDNKIVNGRAWTERDKNESYLSVENKLAQDLQLKIGDDLTFQIGSDQVTARIFNFHSVEWSSFHPNFFIIFIPGVINQFPATYITSFHLASNQTIILNQLIKQFPNITIIDLANILEQILNLIGKASTGLQYIFFFSLGAGILIFIASLQASMDQRKQTYHLIHVLGAPRKYIYKSLMVEFICLGIIILFTSVFLAWTVAWMLEKFIFGF